MTTIYFVRHAEPDFSIKDERMRSLTPKGRRDTALVTDFLADKNINAAVCSPYRRSIDTILPFTEKAGLEIELIEDLKERKIGEIEKAFGSRGEKENIWLDNFNDFAKKQWEDFTYKLHGGECLAEVQERNIAALNGVLKKYGGKNIVLGTHGTALSVMINYYDETYGYSNFSAIAGIFPWVVKMEFDGINCMSMMKIDLFKPVKQEDYGECVVRTKPLGEMKAYKYTVIFSKYKGKWLYCKHINRDVYETAGGKIDEGETPLEGAKRELYEETGAVKFDIKPAFDYSVHLPHAYANGIVYLAEIYELSDLPENDMAEVKTFDTVPDRMRFPQILPVLYGHMMKWMEA